MDNSVGQLLPGMSRHSTPVSDHFYALLREPMREYTPANDDYQRTFDRFEYLLGLIHADLNRRQFRENGLWGPVGCFAWRGRHLGMWEHGIRDEIKDELNQQGQNWPLVKAGLFGKSAERAEEVRQKFDNFVAQLPF